MSQMIRVVPSKFLEVWEQKVRGVDLNFPNEKLSCNQLGFYLKRRYIWFYYQFWQEQWYFG